jgi:N-acetyl-gamma-glutamyl-phosphate reductase
MGVRVAVAGASGYAGGELLRIIGGHPDLELGTLAAATSAGAPVTVAHPHLAHLDSHNFEPLDPARLSAADLVFLALPHEESAAVGAALPAGTPVVDLSASFRLADPRAWSAYYRTPHAGQWCYGLPELPGARERIATARRVAAPGCYATAAILALAPLVAAGLAGPRDIVIVAASGTSGAGRSPSAALLATEVIGSMSAYQVGGTHRHTPEIEQALRLALLARGSTPSLREQAPGPHGPEPPDGPGPHDSVMAPWPASDPVVSFTPMLAPMPRGILATCTALLRDPGTTTAALRDTLAAAYEGAPFVRLLPEGRWPSTAATNGSNMAHLQAAVDAHAGRAVVVVAIDNLGKGAAGQAVQAANLMLGLPETTGLSLQGVSP